VIHKLKAVCVVLILSALPLWAVASDCPIFADSFESRVGAEDSCSMVQGVVFKGPFQKGSEVTITLLDEDLEPQQTTFRGTVKEDTGRFAVAVGDVSGPIEITATGPFFHEISDQTTTDPVTLTAIASAEPGKEVGVNLLSSMEVKRLKTLVAAGLGFEDAKATAIGDVIEALFGERPTITDSTAIDEQSDAFVQMLATSAVFLTDAEGNAAPVSQLQQLIALFQDDFADGQVGNLEEFDLRQGVALLAPKVKATQFTDNLQSHFDDLGSSITVPSISSAIGNMLAANTVLVTINVVGDGTVEQPLSQRVAMDSQLEIDLAPNEGSLVDEVTGSCNGEFRANKTQFVTQALGQDCELTVTFSSGGVSLSFDGNGGSSPSTIRLFPGTEITPPTDPSREGHNFAGWNPSLPIQMPDQDLTVVAQWTINTYPIVFDTNGGDALAGMDVEYGTVLTLPTPSRTGYGFVGWSPEPPGTMPASRLELTAIWSEQTYTLSFDSDGGSAIDSQIKAVGTPLNNLPVPTKEGHSFLRWQNLPDGDVMPASDLQLVAQWDINSYTLTFDGNGGNTVDSITRPFGQNLSGERPEPVRAGHTFDGWLPAFPEYMPAANQTLVAQWIPDSVTLHFETDGGSPLPAIRTVSEASIDAPENPSRSGYSFAGWDPSLNATAPTADQTYTALWNPRIYALSLDRQDGNETREELSATFDSPVPNVGQPQRPGHIFAGYFSQPNGEGTQWFDSTGDVADEKKVWQQTGNVVVYAHWVPKNITIRFGETANPVRFTTLSYTAPFGSPLPDFGQPTRLGHTFLGWEPSLPQTMPTEDLVVKPTWAVRNYQLSLFNRRGDLEPIETISVEFNRPTEVTTPTRAGYTFDEWQPEIPDPMWAKDSSHYAVWQPNTYTIDFDVNGADGGVMPPENITATFDRFLNESVGVPERENFTFGGYWDREGGEGNMYFDGFGTPANFWDKPNDATLYARWTDNEYVLEFDTNGGLSISPRFYQTGDPIEAPENPVRFGHEFDRWEPEIPETMPGNHLTVTAQWEPETYTATLLDDPTDSCIEDGDCQTKTMTFEAQPIPVTPPTRTGYQFLGYWLAAFGRSEQIYDASGNGVGPWTRTKEFERYDGDKGTFYLYGHWERQEFTLDFSLGYTPPADSTIEAPRSITQGFESAIDAPITPERVGHAFDRWEDGSGNVGIPATMPAEDRTYTAYWTKNDYTITFETNGGSDVDPMTVQFEATIAPPSTPTRTGYEFDGWQDGDGDPLPATMPAGDVVVTAKWTPKTHAIVLDHQGGASETNSVTATFDSSMPEAPLPSKENATFGGYWTAPDGEGRQYYQSNMTPNQTWTIDADTTLYAYWIMDAQFTVNVVEIPEDGGTTTGTGSYFEDSTITLTATPSDAYVFVGWFEGDELVSDEPTYAYGATRNRNLVARFTRPPTAPVIRVTPRFPSANFDLICEIHQASTDADGDDIAYEYIWTRQVNEDAEVELMEEFTSRRVPASATSADEIWSCEAYAHDGWVLSEASSCENLDRSTSGAPWIAVDGDACGRPIDKLDYCAGTPCKNGGTCSEDADGGTFVCDCSNLPEFTGARCADIDACALMEAAGESPCGEFGRCINSGGGFGCICDDSVDEIGCACCNGLVMTGFTCTVQGLEDTGEECLTEDVIEDLFGPFE